MKYFKDFLIFESFRNGTTNRHEIKRYAKKKKAIFIKSFLLRKLWHRKCILFRQKFIRNLSTMQDFFRKKMRFVENVKKVEKKVLKL